MSWFALGGNAGFALGPVLVTPVLHFGGLGASPLLAIPALVGGLLTVAALRGVSGADAGVVERAGKDDWGQFGRLTVVVIARSMVTFGLATFLAIWVAQRTGGGTLAGGIALVVLFGVGAAGTLLGGVLANRWGRIRTVRVSYAVAIPAVAGVALVPGPAVYLMVGRSLRSPPMSRFPCTPRSARTICRTGSARPAAHARPRRSGCGRRSLIFAIATATSLQWALLSLAVLPVIAFVAARGLVEPGEQIRQSALTA